MPYFSVTLFTIVRKFSNIALMTGINYAFPNFSSCIFELKTSFMIPSEENKSAKYFSYIFIKSSHKFLMIAIPLDC